VVRAAAVVFGTLLLPYVLPILPPNQRQWYADHLAGIPMLVTVLVALQYGIGRRPAPERAFWHLVSVAIGCWLAVWVLDLVAPATWRGNPLSLAEDLLYLLFYLMLVLALELEPARRERGRTLRWVRAAGAIVFAFGLLTYFVLIPNRLTPRQYATWVPSMLLYLSLDTYLVVRLASLWYARSAQPWRSVHGLLLASAALWWLTDGIEALEYLKVLPLIRGGGPLDLFWYAPLASLIAAARVAALAGPPDDRSVPQGRSDVVDTLWGGSLMVYAVAFPLLHLALSLSGVMDPASRAARELVVLVVLLMLSATAFVYQRFLERENRRLAAEHEEVNRQLHVARRLDALGRLAGGIAHDFNNLLTVILAHAGLLREALPAGAAGEADLRQIMEAAKRGRSLVRKLLGVGRQKVLAPRPVDLSRLIHEFYPTVQRLLPESIEVRLFLAPAGPVVQADPDAVEQVFLNLATNARDAMPEGGLLLVETGWTRLDQTHHARLGWGPPGGYGFLSVTDTGIGMDQATQERLFEPFFTTKEGELGSGLGLAVAYGLVKQQGGFIEVRSTPGQGTTVRVLLPKAAAPEAQVGEERERKEERPAQRGGAGVVLLVEDEAAVRRAAARALEASGYRVLAAADGEAGLALFREHQEEIGLVLSDVAMPRLSGAELVAAVKQLRPDVPCLLMSGYAERDLPLRAGLDPAIPFLPKPWTVEELVAKVNELTAGVGTA
jgi:signal transduction histidine kinase/CheY-like chemotaxis protein